MPSRIENLDVRFRNAMTAADLIEVLKDVEPDTLVVFTCDYGDHWHTQQALPVTEGEKYGADAFRDSAYSQSGVAFYEPEDDAQSFCPKCDEMYDGVPTCPKCGGRTVTEDGELTPMNDEFDDDEDVSVIVLR